MLAMASYVAEPVPSLGTPHSSLFGGTKSISICVFAQSA